MALNWNEVRAKAAAFSERHKHARYEKGETQTFYNEFFALFGVDRRMVANYEQRVKNLPGDKQGFIDLFMPGKLIVEQKSAGLDLGKASNQALDYYEWLPEAERPRYILTCDFQRWRLLDLDTGRELRFTLPELKRHVPSFAFISGAEVRQFKNQKPANPNATRLLTKLHRQLEEDGYSGHKLQLLLVRLLFMLFADDTHIWPKDQLLTDLQEKTRADGGDLGAFLTQLFETLNTPEDRRQSSLPDHFKAYPYVNGKLFEESIGTATFNNALRDVLIDASAFDWGSVSPAIFGALFEGVIDKITRRAQGAHYTPEDAIFRLIGPLFLEALHDEFEALKVRKDGKRAAALIAFHQKLASLTFFDPACGAGNFLVVAYRELRELEREVLEQLYPPGSRLPLGAKEISKVKVDQFYGIEIDEFPSQIAQVALWMTDHIANVNLGDVYGEAIPSIPLVTAPNIRWADALEIDWAGVLPPERCSYVFGNPPFVGAKMQSAGQRAQVRRIAQLGGSGGTLDYVAAWFLKAGDYVRGGDARIAFIATNSITQGEQVAQLWPKLFNERRLEIAFGHRTFVWPGRAAVHCVIVGLAQRGNEPKEKRLFSYPEQKKEPVESRHDWLTAYLFDARDANRHNLVESTAKPLANVSRLNIGSQIIDDGHLTFLPAERSAFLLSEPSTVGYFARLIGADELINGTVRFVLNLRDVPVGELRRSAGVAERVRRVRAFREKSKRKSTFAAANHPHRFALEQIPDAEFLVLPRVSSERRHYMPIAWEGPPAVPTDAVIVKLDATQYDFAILTSAMHMAWLRQIGGRLKSDYRYSISLVYNTFPWPDPSAAQRAKIESLAQAVLDARALPRNVNSTLADMYDPDFMPPELHKAHRELDAAVDRLYSPKGFADERARVEHLFRLYEALVMPTAAAAAANRRTNRRVARATN